MVTQLLRAITFDIVLTVKDAEFFELTQAKRDARVQAGLPEYPTPIKKYVRTVSGEQFLEEARDVLRVLGSGSSIFEECRRLARAKNGLFSAMLDSLNELRSYRNNETRLGTQMRSFRDAGMKYERVLDRELQLMLLEARNEDSPIVQIATPTEIDVSELPGVPAVTVQKPLLGGTRVFHNGKLTDDSWKSRLTQVLSAIS